MATLVCTPGGSTDNSYVTVAQADAYWVGDSLWEQQSGAKRADLLIRATREIERLGGTKDTMSACRSLFRGAPSTTTQALHFPRGTINSGWVARHPAVVHANSDVDATGARIIPETVRDAVCEQARWLLDRELNPPLVDHASLQAQGVKTFGVDGLSVSYGAATAPQGISPVAYGKLRQYITRNARAAL